MKALLRLFTSVKLAIVLLILIILASILGTLIPQGGSAGEYLARYGQLGPLFQRLELTSLYQSFWYIALLSLFGLNIIVCTVTRLTPKIQRAFRPKIETEPRNLLALKVKDKCRLTAGPGNARKALKEELARRRYRVKESEVRGTVWFLARKRVLGGFGSDIVHLGLLVILAGGILSGLAGFRQSLTFLEGQTIEVPGADFSVRLDKFVTEYYPNGSVKDWKSYLTVIEEGSPRVQKAVEVNHPLQHQGHLFYQSGYGWDWQSPTLEVWVKKASAPSSAEKLELKVGEKRRLADGDLQVSAVRFLPDFVLDENRQPATRSLEPNNPAVFLEGWKKDEKVFSGWVFARFPDFSRMHGAEPADLSFELRDVRAPQYSVIQMARDPGVPLIWAGCTVLMVGLFLAFYWPTRELRFFIEESGGKSEITAGGIAAKGREAFEQEFAAILHAMRKTQ